MIDTANDLSTAVRTDVLAPDELREMHAYWRAANYLSVGQIYLYDNPLLAEPLTLEHIKPRLLGHWGTTPGINFVYVHLNRLIKRYDLGAIFVTGHAAAGGLETDHLGQTDQPVLGRDVGRLVR